MEENFDLFATEGSQTPEEEFYDYLRLGKMPKLYNCEYWLKHELYVQQHLREHGYLITKNVSTGTGTNKVELPHRELVNVLIKYYLQMYHLPRFLRTDGRAACDIDKVIALIMADPTMKKIVHQTHEVT